MSDSPTLTERCLSTTLSRALTHRIRDVETAQTGIRQKFAGTRRPELVAKMIELMEEAKSLAASIITAMEGGHLRLDLYEAANPRLAAIFDQCNEIHGVLEKDTQE